MSIHGAAIFSYGLVVLFLVWIAVFAFWRSYRISALQHRLAILRDRLSELAAMGNISGSCC